MNIFPFKHQNDPIAKASLLPSHTSLRLLCYGLYAILCQLTLILLHTNVYAASIEGAHLATRFFPMAEHALMSLAILAIGVYLIERVKLENKQ